MAKPRATRLLEVASSSDLALVNGTTVHLQRLQDWLEGLAASFLGGGHAQSHADRGKGDQTNSD